MLSETDPAARMRLTLAAIGALAGAALWIFVEIADQVENQRLFLITVTFAAVLFPVWLALTGPQTATQAGNMALALAAPGAALMGLASLRYADMGRFLDPGLHPAALFGAMIILTGFAAVWLRDPARWRSYPDLFDASWRIFVRLVGASIFTGVVWILLFLSNEVLEIVGLTIIEDILDIDWVPFVLTGGVLGLGLAVLHEFRDRVSPFVPLRLLRLLVPLVLVVAAVFTVALALRGFDSIPSGLSPAATLLAMSVAGITLITVALDRTREDEVTSPTLRRATRALAALLPVLAGAAGLALGLRVAQYGWTPERLAGALAAASVMVYSLVYCLAAVRGDEWMARIRAANAPLALGLAAVGLLWLTPLIHAEAISARSQAARYLDGGLPAEAVAAWELTHDWGKAGRKAAERLRADDTGPDHAALVARLDDAAARDRRGAFDLAGERAIRAEKAKQLAAVLPVLPAGEFVPAKAWERLDRWRIDQVLNGCAEVLPDGRPGCLLILARFNPDRRERQGLLLYATPGRHVTGDSVIEVQGVMALTHGVRDLTRAHQAQWSREDLMALADGAFRVAPSGRNALYLGDRVFAPTP